MDVISACPLRVGSVLWQPRPGTFVLTVVCKATYTLLPAESPLAHEQEPPNETDDHWNDDEHRSLHGASDLAPFKQHADVFLVGHAYAPRRQPVASLIARMIVGDVDKSIEVHADRVWTQDGQLRQGPRFVKMPLRYERAGGGPMTSNPVGMRPDARPDRYGQVPVPNLQPPGHHVARPEDAIPPVGLGPIAPAWPGRAAMLYGHAAGWDHRTGLAWPLPQGLDPGFFNAAPPDQRAAELRSNERIVLEHLHPEHERLSTSLAGIAPKAMVERTGAAPQALSLRCDTLSIDTDRGVCNLVWRGVVALARPDEAGRVSIAMVTESSDAAVQTLVGAVRAARVLPFARAEAPEEEEPGRATIPMPTAGPANPVMPFREVSPWEEAPALARASDGAGRRGESDGTGTILAMRGQVREVLPFAAAISGREAPAAPLQAAAPAPRDDAETLDVAPEEVYGPTAPAPAFALVPLPQHPFEPSAPFAFAPAPPPLSTPPPAAALPPEAAVELPAPPPMIGPLATAEMAEQESPRERGDTSPLATPAPVRPLLSEPDLPLVEFPIERCAAIAASMARRKTDRSKILEDEELAPRVWEALERHWVNEIRKETKRGKTALLKTYDAAYLERLEEERGPLEVEEYARLVVAGERGGVEAALADLTLPRGAMLRIQRVWTGRIAADAGLGMSVRMAVEAARESDPGLSEV